MYLVDSLFCAYGEKFGGGGVNEGHRRKGAKKPLSEYIQWRKEETHGEINEWVPNRKPLEGQKKKW